MSGVYIPGMKMPTSCWLCHFQDCGNCVLNNHKVVDNCILEDRRDEECPLIPVPPHGRLVDADALRIRDSEKKAYEAHLREKGEFFTEETVLEYYRGKADGLIHASGLVRFAPTILPADKEAGE